MKSEWRSCETDAIDLGAFTPRCRTVLRLAREAAVHSGSRTVEPAHIAEGLVKLGEGIHWNVWKRIGFRITEFRERNRMIWRTEGQISTLPNRVPVKPPLGTPLSLDSEELLRLAKANARRLNHSYVGPEHLLLSLIEMKSPVSILFQQMGLSSKTFKTAMLEELDPLRLDS